MKFGDTWRSTSYSITGNPEEADNKYHYSNEIKGLLFRTQKKVHKKKIKNPQALLKLIERYPNIPAFKNYLVVHYILNGKHEKGRSANHWLVKEHPDYLFGKLNLCAEYLEDDKLDEIPKVLGEALDLKDLYPERKVFFVQEFSSFLNISCRYLIANKEFEAAESRIKPASEILGDDHPVIIQLRDHLNNEILLQKLEGYKDAWEQRQFALEKLAELPNENYLDIQTTEPPVFNHPEIWKLYEHGLRIDRSILEKILALPRNTLIEDLEKVLLDAVQRFHFFEKKLKEEELWEEKGTYSLHAIALLSQLGAKEKLPKIIEHFSKEALLESWYGDHIYETLWHFVYRLAQDDLNLLMSFHKDGEVSSATKVVIQQAVLQVALHQPERKEEVIQWYKEVLEYCLENLANPKICDEDVVTNAVTDLTNFPCTELLPLIEICFALDLVDPMMCGDYEDVKAYILSGKDYELKYNLHEDIFSHYEHIVKTWHGYKSEEERKAENEEFEKRLAALKEKEKEQDVKIRELKQQLVSKNRSKITQPKVGRNEPCPCGSGKKYKKCCLRK